MKKIITMGTETEFSEFYSGKVKLIAGGAGYIPFFKKYLGRVVNILIPKEEKYCWILTKDDLNLLIGECKKVKFEGDKKYWKQDKEEFEDCINNIKTMPNSFNLDDLKTIICELDDIATSNRKLIIKIKKSYNL